MSIHKPPAGEMLWRDHATFCWNWRFHCWPGRLDVSWMMYVATSNLRWGNIGTGFVASEGQGEFRGDMRLLKSF